MCELALPRARKQQAGCDAGHNPPTVQSSVLAAQGRRGGVGGAGRGVRITTRPPRSRQLSSMAGEKRYVPSRHRAVAPFGGGPSGTGAVSTARAVAWRVGGGGGASGTIAAGTRGAAIGAGRTESTGALTGFGATAVGRADSAPDTICAAVRARGAARSGCGADGGGGRSGGALSRLGGGGADCAPSDASGDSNAPRTIAALRERDAEVMGSPLCSAVCRCGRVHS